MPGEEWMVLGALGVRVSWYCSPYEVIIPFSSFSPSFYSSIPVPDLNQMTGCKYMHLPLSVAGRASLGTAMPGSCVHAQYGLSNSVRIWCVHMGWIPSCSSHWVAFLSDSGPFCPCISFRQEQFWVKFFWRWVCCPLPQLVISKEHTWACSWPRAHA